MKKSYKRIFAFILVISLILTSSVSAFAATGEKYLCELRLIYADTFNEAKEILSDTEFDEYKLLNENLNEDTNETGVWLAYKTTTNIEEAITDIATIQMNGGYQEGNYQEMIKQSYESYLKMGEIYLQAIDYFMKAYDEGDFMAESAFRQLNFYNVVSENIPTDKIPDFDGEKLGDIFYEGVDKTELATMFLEGNSYALRNIRSLIAMGVSYNSDGKTYLQKVSESAELMERDAKVFDNKDYEELAELIAPTINTFRTMFEELSLYEDNFDFEDDNYTDEEIKYIEYKAIAEMMRNQEYLGGKTLYEFCLQYTSKQDTSVLYPLVDALNDGQRAMSYVAHYYDVVRYSMSSLPTKLMEEELTKLEETYGDNPFNIYEGVDRTIYNGTFALTSEAYRADSYNEASYLEEFFGLKTVMNITKNVVIGATGVGIFYGAAVRHGNEIQAYNAAKSAMAAAKQKTADVINAVGSQNLTSGTSSIWVNIGKTDYFVYTHEEFLDVLIANAKPSAGSLPANATFAQKYDFVVNGIDAHAIPMNPSLKTGMKLVTKHVDQASNTVLSGQESAEIATQAAATKISLGTISLYLLGGAMMLYATCNLGYTVYSYFNPKYEDIPIAMVDLIATKDGDRYIKYDVVYEAEQREKGVYAAGDLNAFEGQRWNALYYTKNYEAGKPLLADEFVLSTSNNKAKKGYTPIHRFGEEICYDLNKYNFSDKSPSIYLSVKQSKNDKSAVADVPQVVGSIFANGIWLLIGGVGTLFGVGGTLGTQALLKKRKTKNGEQNA